MPCETLHNWLSGLNGCPHCYGRLAIDVNQGRILEELDRSPLQLCLVGPRKPLTWAEGMDVTGEMMKMIKA